MDMVIDPSGNVIVTGGVGSFGMGQDDLALVKFSPSGTKLWNVTWGGHAVDRGRDIVMDASGNFYIGASVASFGAGNADFGLVKFDSSGALLWNYTWGGPGADFPWGIALDTSGNHYISGYSNSFGAGGYDLALVKFDSSGTKLWNVTWGGASSDYGRDIAIDASGDIYVPGYTFSYGLGSSDIALVKFAPNGTKLWNTTWGGTGADQGWGVTVDCSGNAYVSGYTHSYGAGGADLALLKYKVGEPCSSSIPGFEVLFVLLGLIPLLAVGLYHLILRKGSKSEILLVN